MWPCCANDTDRQWVFGPRGRIAAKLRDQLEEPVSLSAIAGDPLRSVSPFPHEGIKDSLGMKAQMLVEFDGSLVRFCHGE